MTKKSVDMPKEESSVSGAVPNAPKRGRATRKKPLLRNISIALIVVALLFISNYMVFTAARSLLSAMQGYQELKYLDRDGTCIANLDPECNMMITPRAEKRLGEVYDRLNSEYDHAFYMYGFVVSLPNEYGMDVPIGYMNERYAELNEFDLCEGTYPDFDSKTYDSEIPVIIGKGLSKTYAVGSTFTIDDPMSGKTLLLKVAGVLKANACHSNFYDLNMKYFYNFSILLPVDADFIANANIDLRLNGLNDLIILDSTPEKVTELGELIQDSAGLKYNFFTQSENFGSYLESYIPQLAVMLLIALVCASLAALLSVKNAMFNARIIAKSNADGAFSLKDRMASLKAVRIGFVAAFLVDLIAVFAITARTRHGYWQINDATVAAFGFMYLTGTDWLALTAALVLDIIFGMILVKVISGKLEKLRNFEARA